MPTTSGNTAARPRKNSSESRNSSGNANSSARAEVLGDRLAELGAGDGAATHDDVVAALEGGDRVGRDHLIVDARAQRPHHEATVAVVRGRAGFGARDAGHRRELGRGRLRRRVVAADEQDDAGRGLLAGGALELRRRQRGFRVGRREAVAAVEAAGHRAADHPRQDHEDEQDEEGAPGALG